MTAALGTTARGLALPLHVMFHLLPTWEPVLARKARLRIVKLERHRAQVCIALVFGGGQVTANLLQGSGIAGAVVTEQFFGLLAQVLEIGALGEWAHGKPPCIDAVGPQYRLHKGFQLVRQKQVG